MISCPLIFSPILWLYNWIVYHVENESVLILYHVTCWRTSNMIDRLYFITNFRLKCAIERSFSYAHFIASYRLIISLTKPDARLAQMTSGADRTMRIIANRKQTHSTCTYAMRLPFIGRSNLHAHLYISTCIKRSFIKNRLHQHAIDQVDSLNQLHYTLTNWTTPSHYYFAHQSCVCVCVCRHNGQYGMTAWQLTNHISDAQPPNDKHLLQTNTRNSTFAQRSLNRYTICVD